MVKYLYAKDEAGDIVNINDIDSQNKTKYHCIECGMEMSAVLGKKREHHFRHKGDSCSYESYLHKICKIIIKDRFDKSDKFEVSYRVSRDCNKEDCKLRCEQCNRENEQFTIDLKQYYTNCELESTYLGYRGDIKLSNPDNSNILPLFIEIAVTHECTSEKIESGIPIIEIKVINEINIKDCPIIENPCCDLDSSFIKFYNFPTELNPTTKVSRFSVYSHPNEGFLYPKFEKNLCICTEIEPVSTDKTCKLEIFIKEPTKYPDFNLLYFCFIKALQQKIRIKDCWFCDKIKRCVFNYRDKRYMTSDLLKHKLLSSCYANRCDKFQFKFLEFPYKSSEKDILYIINTPNTEI